MIAPEVRWIEKHPFFLNVFLAGGEIIRFHPRGKATFIARAGAGAGSGKSESLLVVGDLSYEAEIPFACVEGEWARDYTETLTLRQVGSARRPLPRSMHMAVEEAIAVVAAVAVRPEVERLLAESEEHWRVQRVVAWVRGRRADIARMEAQIEAALATIPEGLAESVRQEEVTPPTISDAPPREPTESIPGRPARRRPRLA